MRWTYGRQSTNVEDRRGAGGRMGGPAMIGGAGGVGIVILALVAMFFGIDPSVVLDGGIGGGAGDTATREEAPAGPSSPQEAERERFVRYVLGDTEDTWHQIFRSGGAEYREPTLVLFSGAVRSACGAARSATGPFYCPADQKMYLDLSFFDELARRFRAPGDFAQAYVVAHEVGHHVQTLLGITQRVSQARQQLSEGEANRLSVMTELQADCLAGVWAKHADEARQVLEAGDIDEGLRAAAAVGDDRMQRQARGEVVPDSFTHGSSEQRARWFQRGFESGSLDACDTFQAEQL